MRPLSHLHTQEILRLHEPIFEKLAERQFDALENEVVRIFQKAARWENGMLKMPDWFDAFGHFHRREHPDWDQLMANLDLWRSRRRSSRVAPVATAFAHISQARAYEARNDEKKARRCFQDADAVLQEIPVRGLLIQPYYTARILTARALKAPREDVLRLAERATYADPDYDPHFFQTTAYLLQHGDARRGEWQKWLLENRSGSRSGNGAPTYAITTWRMVDQFYFSHKFDLTKLRISAPLVYDGFEALLQNFPGSPAFLGGYLTMAYKAGDKEMAAHVLKLMEGGYDPAFLESSRAKTIMRWL